jgi:hypothetical protein
VQELKILANYMPVVKLALNLFESKKTGQKMFELSRTFLDDWNNVQKNLKEAID